MDKATRIQKQESVRQLIAHTSLTKQSIADIVGIHIDTVYTWIKTYGLQRANNLDDNIIDEANQRALEALQADKADQASKYNSIALSRKKKLEVPDQQRAFIDLMNRMREEAISAPIEEKQSWLDAIKKTTLVMQLEDIACTT